MINFDCVLPIANCDELTNLHTILFPELTKKEVECLYWFILDERVSEVASTMNISENSIKKYIKNITIKLNAITIRNIKFIYHRRFQNYQQKQLLDINRQLETNYFLLLLILKNDNSTLIP